MYQLLLTTVKPCSGSSFMNITDLITDLHLCGDTAPVKTRPLSLAPFFREMNLQLQLKTRET